MLRKLQCILFVTLFSAPAVMFAAGNPQICIIPKPVTVKMKSGAFKVDDKTRVLYEYGNDDVAVTAGLFTGILNMAGFRIGASATELRDLNGQQNVIVFKLLKNKHGLPSGEGYNLSSEPGRILVEGSGGAGVFYGMQSLMQLLPPEIYAGNANTVKDLSITCLEIRDYPRFPYRGMHLDVSRHFFPKEFIKKYIDLIAMYKMNTFHWHLTDDNGWRIEIKKYPLLTKISAWRVDREKDPWTERLPQKPGEEAAYGGFYTQEDVKEIVKYAADRHVTIIPEIEMPAHSVEVLAAYPELSCTGGPFTVPPGSYWPNSDIFCAGNDSVFIFLQDVLTEIMELFPSKYIHIGGDEADKTNWKKCQKCQARMSSEGLKNEEELQSWFIRRIEKFVLSKNRRIIGWDEILSGGLASEATVMSWQGIEGGIAAARQGHDAIMTPGDYCYFDKYQADPLNEPKAIGGFLTLKKVYSYEPVPEELDATQRKHILGAQGNVWTEYIPTPERAEYMAFPRMIALSEVDWSPEGHRIFSEFRKRLAPHLKKLDYLNVSYSKGSFQVSLETGFDKKTGKVSVNLSSEQPDVPIFYTTNGKDPSVKTLQYNGPFTADKNIVIKAGLFLDGKSAGPTAEKAFLFHYGVGKKIRYQIPYSERYPAGGPNSLIDGLRGSKDHHDGLWQGFRGTDLDVVIDFGKEIPVTSVMTTVLQNQKAWIFLPKYIEYSLSSDGKKWHSINRLDNKIPQKEEQVFIQPFTQPFPMTKARYLRVFGKYPGDCPDWHPGAGQPCWMFADEIAVY